MTDAEAAAPASADSPLISCIVPVCNCERYLAEALDSIFAQTWRPIEVVVVDDGSTDGTPAVIEAYPHTLVRRRQENRGAAAARNAGLEAASGEFVAFLDADDLWHEDKLSRQMAMFRDRPDLQLCITKAKKFWIPEMREEGARLAAHTSSRAHPGFVCQTLLARRGLFDRVGTFDESLRIGEDTDWFMRVRHSGLDIAVVDEILVRRRMHQNNLSYTVHDDRGREDRLKIAAAALRRQRELAGRA